MNDRRGLAYGMATVVLVATALTALTAGTSDAHGATSPVTAGNGWKLQAPNITHIDTQPLAIAFHDTTSRTKLTPYVKKVAAELTSYGIPVTLTTRIVPTKQGTCPPSHTISYRWISKPNPDRPNQSYTGTCGRRGALYSAYVYINSDYWAVGRRFYEWQRLNVVWHESGHAVGLSHPATCPRNAAGLQPLMCADPYKDLRDRRYTTFEATAFKNLRLNRIYYPLP